MSLASPLGRPLSTHMQAPETRRASWVEHTIPPSHSDPNSLSSRGAPSEANTFGATQLISPAVGSSSQIPSLGDRQYQPDRSYQQAGPASFPSAEREAQSSASEQPLSGVDVPVQSQSLTLQPHPPPPVPIPAETARDTRPTQASAINTPRQSSSSPPGSDVTARDPSSHDVPTKRKQRPEELNDPSEKHFKKAGMVAAAATGLGAGEAGKILLVNRANREPRGWRETNFESKHHVHHRAIRGSLKQAAKKAFMIYGIITLLVWCFLSFFWGSIYLVENNFRNLNVYVISFDTVANSFLTEPVLNQATYLANEDPSVPHLGWQIRDAALYPNGLDDVRHEILGQNAWAAIVVNANATTAWTTAVQNGDATYDPTGAIGVYYQSARFYQVILLYFPGLIAEFLGNPLSSARAAALQSFVTSSTGNTTAITLAQRVPQAIGVGFGYTTFDLRPIQNSAWSGAAPMEASLIYFIIFAFVAAMFGAASRMKTGLGSKLTFASLLALRFGWTLFAYFFISLWETCVIAAFQVPLQNYIGRAGFPVLWALNYVTLIAAGWAMETIICFTGPTFFPLFLIIWIIINITSSFFPLELMPTFYKWLVVTPFYNNVYAYKIIAYGTNFPHKIGYYFGILFALIGVELIGFPMAVFYERWSNDRSMMRSKAKEEEEEKGREKQG